MFEPPADPLMKVSVLSSPAAPQGLIWLAMHQCYSTEPCHNPFTAPLEKRAGELVVKHLLAGNKGHYSPLEAACYSLNFAYVPKDIMTHFTRHRTLSYSVQSFRYSDPFSSLDCDAEAETIIEDNAPSKNLERVIYVRQPGKYVSREGSYTFTNTERCERFLFHLESILRYQAELKRGVPPEDARTNIGSYRQHAVVTGNLRSWLHLLDMRHKGDAQCEWLSLTNQIGAILERTVPEVFDWYKTHRLGKGTLAP